MMGHPENGWVCWDSESFWGALNAGSETMCDFVFATGPFTDDYVVSGYLIYVSKVGNGLEGFLLFVSFVFAFFMGWG